MKATTLVLGAALATVLTVSAGATVNLKGSDTVLPLAQAWASKPELARSHPKETVARFLALPVHSSVDVLLSPP